MTSTPSGICTEPLNEFSKIVIFGYFAQMRLMLRSLPLGTLCVMERESSRCRVEKFRDVIIKLPSDRFCPQQCALCLSHVANISSKKILMMNASILFIFLNRINFSFPLYKFHSLYIKALSIITPALSLNFPSQHQRQEMSNLLVC